MKRPRRDDGVEAIDELLQRLVPGNLGELAAAAITLPAHRRDDAIGVIGDLDGRLAADAELPLAERVLWIALELLDEPRARHAWLPVADHLGVPSMTRAVTPHPAAHNGHTLGFQTAMPGVISSSGTKRMTWFSGLPQLASAALVPVIAVTFRKRRRSMSVSSAWGSVVTRQAVVRRLLFLVAVHAEPHVHVHHPSGDGLLLLVPMAGGAIDSGADVGSVLEAHVGGPRVVVDALPREIEALLLHLGHLLD